MRVLVIGGTGFIGRHVVDSLIEKGHETTVLHRGKSQTTLNEKAKSLIGDRQLLIRLSEDVKKIQPDVVIDMIPKTASEMWSLLRTTAGISSRLVVVSSIDVYRAYNRLRRAEPGEPDLVPLTESSPLRDQLFPYRGNAADALSPAYQYEKILVERLALAEPGLATTVMRLPVVYGPGDGQNRIHEYLKRMDDGREAILLGRLQSDWRVTRGFVKDVAACVAKAASDTSAENHLYNVGEEEALTEREWVTRIGIAAGWKGQVVIVDDEALPEHLKQDFDWRQHLSIDSGLLYKELGYTQSKRHESLEETIKWQRKNAPGETSQFDYQLEDNVLKSFRGLASARQA